MDAKKASQLMKPIYLKDTRSFKYMNWIFVGIVGFSFALGGSIIHYKNKYGDFKQSTLRKLIEEYIQSEEYFQRMGAIHGLFPPPKKFFDETDAQNAKVKVNPLIRGF